jgi:NADP-dependent 3-hydroxy acid dehydrogenase YdfG
MSKTILITGAGSGFGEAVLTAIRGCGKLRQ